MKKYLVIGNPIEHSLSPNLHNFWIKENNLDAIYGKLETNENDLEEICHNIKKGELNGVNVTVPFKKKIIPYLDVLSGHALRTQSVNTICINNGNLTGYNTDIDGFELSIKKLEYDLNNKSIVILGAGGVVPSIIYALKRMNASNISLTNRTKEKAENIKDLFKDITILDWGDVTEFDMIINATSIGLKEDEKFGIDFKKFGNNKLFYDVIYNPTQTGFLKEGKKLGNLSENGKLMFIYQALEAFKLWHGIEPRINNKTLELLEND